MRAKPKAWWSLTPVCALFALAAAAFAQNTNTQTEPQPPSQPSRSTLTDEQVVTSIKGGVDFLLATKNQDNWEFGRHWSGQRGGETALVLYALLHAAQSLQDDPVYAPRLHYRGAELGPVVEWLSTLEPRQTYTVALQALSLGMLPKRTDDRLGASIQSALQRDQRYLIAAMGPEGGYTYSRAEYRPRSGSRDGFGDLSNAQYGALGMWALEDAGMPAPPVYWTTTDRFWRTLQNQNGSWPYQARPNEFVPSDSMGLAGIATLYMTSEFVDKTVRSLPKADRNLDLAMAWVNSQFTPDFGDLYSMYTVERIGMASGLKHIGAHDWYRELADNIIAHQNRNGSWDEISWKNSRSFPGASPTTATSYALLFLARGRNPILFNKLQYEGASGAISEWNSRPMDDAFLTRWISKKYEKPLNWQVVNLKVDPKEWLDAPILLITGSKDPQFTPEDIDKLRTFVEAGGMIFSNADDNSPKFTEAIRKYANDLVRGKHEMRLLLKDHFFYGTDLNVSMTNPPIVMGLSNGIRELWVHSPTDLAASWQLRRAEPKSYFELPTALFFYQTGKGPLEGRLKTLDIPEPAIPPVHSINFACIITSGNSDPEPNAWPRLARLLKSRGISGLDLKITSVPLSELDAAKYPIAHLTGTATFLVKSEDCILLRKYLDAGGTLLVDSGGGSDSFTDSFRAMAAQIYPDSKLAPLPPNHPLYTGDFKAGLTKPESLAQITFRRYGESSLGRKITEPAIDSLTVEGRERILFSRYDLTSGLLGTNTWGITGYTPESAQKIATNLLLWPLRDTSGK